MSARTVAPGTADRRHPHSRRHGDRVRHWLYADPPFAYHQLMTWPARAKFWTARLIRTCWLWRDISLGPIVSIIAFLWGWSPIRLFWFPHLPLWFLVTLAACISYWSLRFDSSRGHTANKDRIAHRFKRWWQKACLDCEVTPIPELTKPIFKTHVTEALITYVAGTDDASIYRKVARRMSTIAGHPVTFHPHGNGTATVAIHLSDPLKDEPELPAHLGNDTGVDLAPTCYQVPVGVDRDGDPYSLRLFEKSLLVVGSSGSGKSTTIEALTFTLLNAPHCEPWVIDPQDVSFGAVRNLVPYAHDPFDAMTLLRDYHTSMKKRELEMAERGTSLATPSGLWPFKVLIVDEFLRFFDAVELGKPYVDEFQSKLRDVLSTGRKTGHSVIALATDPYSKLLEDGLKSKFTLTLCFKTRDINATKVAVGVAPPGFRPHEIPAGQPGRCILMGEDDWHHLRTYRVWDEQARKVATSLTAGPAATCQPTAVTATDRQEALTTGHVSNALAVLPAARPFRRRDETRGLILNYLRQVVSASVAQIASALDIPERTVRYWLLDKNCRHRIPVQPVGSGVYCLAGDPR